MLNLSSLKLSSNERGQAILEYILVLVVVVSIILGVLYQFNSAFEKYLNSYFGDYIACLLETGELPSLGGGGAGSDICNASFEPFSLSKGRPIKESNGGGRGGRDGEGEDGEGEEGEDGEDGEGGSDDPSSASGRSSGRRGNRPRSSQFNNSGSSLNGELSSDRPGRQRIRLSGRGLNKDKSKEGEAGGQGGLRSVGRRVVKRRYVLGEEYLSKKNEKKKQISSSKKVNLKSAEGVTYLRKPRFDLEVPKPPKPIEEDSRGLGLSLGFFIRLLIILAIIVGIFVLLGGQLLQIKKNWEK